jgi:hypothetical protein
MKICNVKHIVTAIICIVLSIGAYSAEDLYDSELSGLAYINVPFGNNSGHSSPTLGFAIGQTPTNTIFGSSNNLNPLLNNPTRKSLFDVQYDLTERRWSRFAFGGINALVYDDVLHANGEGGGPVIDPALVVLGIGAGGLIYMALNSDDPPHECSEGMTQIDPPLLFSTLNLHEPCAPPPPDSDIRLKRDIESLVALENGIKLYSFKYLWDDTVYVGVMAQDLLEHGIYQDAVVKKQSGFYAVHYEMLGLKMVTLDEWKLDQESIYIN